MVASYTLLYFALVASVASAFSLAGSKKSSSGSVVPNRYIIEFDSSAHLTSSGLKRAATPHEYIYREIEARSSASSYTVHQEYSCALFYGASLTFSAGIDVSILLNITGIIDLHQVHLLSLPEIVSSEDSQWSAKTASGSSRNSTSSVTSAQQSATTSKSTPFSNLPQIGADQVHASGNKGQGVKIGIVDGGVDYTREPLGGCFGSGCKIQGGYDFVGDDYDGTNDPVPDSDPYDNCYAHGTTIAGIIGANDNVYGVTGVAPEASLYVYRVFGCGGDTTEDLVLAGMTRAYDDGMDIINLSLGETSGWTEGVLAAYAARVVAEGTIITSSAGNHGEVGGFYAGSPAAGSGVINTGSSDNSIYPGHLANVSTGYGPIPYYMYKAFSAGTLQLYTFDSDAYGCTLPDDVPDLSPYLVVVRRGTCTLYQKAENVYDAGGTAIFVVDDDDDVPIYQNFDGIDFAIIGPDDGNYLLDLINSTANATVSFSFDPIALPNNWTVNTTSYFSQIGPTNDLYFAPSVVAPGSNIIGVTPSALYNWTIGDGTSYSSAFAAGAAALYVKAKGTDVSPTQVKSALEITSEQLPLSISDSSLASVAVQGAGRLQISDAIDAGAVITPSEILLNDTAYFVSSHVLTIKNPSSKKVTYKFEHEAAGTALAFQTGLNQSNDEPLPQVSSAANVGFGKSSLTIAAGKTSTITLQFTAPTGLDAQTFPIYSGFITITGGATTVRVPYMGVAAKMKDMPVLDPTSYYLGIETPVILDVDGNTQESNATYTFSNTSYPTVLYRLVGGTPSLLIDLIDADTNLTFTADYTTRKRSFEDNSVQQQKRSLSTRRLKATGSSSTRTKTSSLTALLCRLTNYKTTGCSSPSNTFSSVPILGNLLEDEYLPRDTDNADSEGGAYEEFELSTAEFSNGTVIPNGTYRFLLRALHITGEKNEEADYESWVSKPFTVAQ